MNAAIYARTNTVNKKSLRKQVKECRKFASDKNIIVSSDNIYVDEAISGDKLDRKGLNDLMAAAKNSNFEAILVYDLARVSRNMTHVLSLATQFKSLGISLITVTGDKYPSKTIIVEILKIIEAYGRRRHETQNKK